MTPGARLRVDSIACDGRGLCAEVLPELITLDDWGFPIIRAGEAPAGLLDEAGEAVQVCPKPALRLETGSSRRRAEPERGRQGAHDGSASPAPAHLLGHGGAHRGSR